MTEDQETMLQATALLLKKRLTANGSRVNSIEFGPDVNVDVAPIANVMKELGAQLIGTQEVLSQLVQVLADQQHQHIVHNTNKVETPVNNFSPVINNPEPKVVVNCDMTPIVQTLATLTDLMTQLVAMVQVTLATKKRNLLISHSDGTTTTITEK
jgi:hypothetical protein